MQLGLFDRSEVDSLVHRQHDYRENLAMPIPTS